MAAPEHEPEERAPAVCAVVLPPRGLGRAPGAAGSGHRRRALVVGLAAPIAALAGIDPLVASTPVRTVGTALAVLGVLLTLSAQLSLGDSWRIGIDETERTELVTDGAFSVVRNPIFSAMVVTAAGLTLMVPNLVAVVGLAALLVALELQVRGAEEPHLRSLHGEQYLDYTRRVGRFVPGLGRLHRP